MFEFTIERELGLVGGNGKALNLVAWGENPAKLDLRAWRETEQGLRAGKGVTLTENEARDLSRLLNEYLEAIG